MSTKHTKDPSRPTYQVRRWEFRHSFRLRTHLNTPTAVLPGGWERQTDITHLNCSNGVITHVDHVDPFPLLKGMTDALLNSSVHHFMSEQEADVRKGRKSDNSEVKNAIITDGKWKIQIFDRRVHMLQKVQHASMTNVCWSCGKSQAS